MPSEERSAEVGGAEDVEATAESASGDTIKSGEIPADLGLVDREVGGDWTIAPLGFEDIVCVKLFDRLACCGSAKSGLVGYRTLGGV